MEFPESGSQSYGAAVMERLRAFFVQHCEPPRSTIPAELQQESTSQSTAARALWVQEVDCMKLLASCPELGQPLYQSTLALLDTLRAESAALCREAEQVVRPDDISIRLTHLPTLSANLPTLPPRRGQLVQVCGSIVRMSTKRVVPYAYRLMCPRCHSVVEDFTHPFDRAAQHKRTCERATCKKEELQIVGQVWMDYAECRLQQRSNQSGRLPRSILVTLDDELSAKCSVGQFVEVIGILHPTWRHLYPLSRPAIEPAIWAVNVLPMEAYRGAALMAGVGSGSSAAANQRRKGGRQGERPKFNPEAFLTSFLKNKRRRGVALVNSTAPQLAGLFAPRMSLLLSALNGTSMAGKTSMHIRSTIHCLFVGDPSTGKSQLLRFAASVAPRSTSTTGMGSTSAGLTVAATKEQGEWVLEPGALVLSDGGVCVIDELRTVSPADRASLHEAMEQQTISVAKGGLVTKLRTACSVLSACNPPPLKRNGRAELGIGGPLLSRFDFIFLLWDTPQEDVDTRVADHVLSCNVANRHPEPPLLGEELARYLWWLRAQYAQAEGPLLSDAAADLLGRYYEIQRQRGASPSLDNAVPVTIRLLESLVRITQAHAKLHLQSVCTMDDAAMAIFLMERSAHSLKVPLRVLGPDVYSSTRELDEVFLSDTPECLALQEAVLRAIADVIQKYTLPPPPPLLEPPTASEAEYGNDRDGSSLISLNARGSRMEFQFQPVDVGQGGRRSRSFSDNGGAPEDVLPAQMFELPSDGGGEQPAPAMQLQSVQSILGGASTTFRGPSDNGLAGSGNRGNNGDVFAMSQYERCQLAVPRVLSQGTQSSSGDELTDGGHDLLAFRRRQQHLHDENGALTFFTRLTHAGTGTGAAATNANAGPPAGIESPNRKSCSSQEALAKESAAELLSAVNSAFAVQSSRATYASDAFATGRAGGRASSSYSAASAAAVAELLHTSQLHTPTPIRRTALPSLSTPDCTSHSRSVVSSISPLFDERAASAMAVPLSNSSLCPPSVQQTAPFGARVPAAGATAAAPVPTGPQNHGCAFSDTEELIMATPLETTHNHNGLLSSLGDTLPPPQLITSQSRQGTQRGSSTPQGTQSGKKRMRSAEDIMRNLRFQF